MTGLKVDIGHSDEDTLKHFSEADLLHNLHDVDGSLHVVGVPTSTHGTITGDAVNGYSYTPDANYHGPAEISYKVSDGTTQYERTASLEVDSVVDAATVKMEMSVEQHVIEFGQADTGSLMNVGALQTNGPINSVAVDFSIIGGPQVAVNGYNGPTFFSYGNTHSTNEMYAWNPNNLTIAICGHEYATGIDTTLDTKTHRYTMLWDSATGVLDVLKDGVPIFEKHGVSQGDSMPGGGVFALAQD